MFTIFTDTDTDLTLKEANEYGYKLISMPYIINDVEVKPYVDFEEFDYHTFYDILRTGVVPKTCAISPEAYREYFIDDFKNGNDIIYVHFSSAMSGTFNALNIAIQELKEEYPNATFNTIDTLGISILCLNIVKEVGKMYLEGKNKDEILEWAKEHVPHYATYFYADNLDFFAKSGRVSNFSKFFGNLIGIKPIIYLNPEGKMINLAKERGANKALRKLLEYYDTLAIEKYDHRIIIGHTDALDKAQKLANMLIERYGDKLNIEYSVVNPTIGSHCGPDCVGISFYAKHK